MQILKLEYQPIETLRSRVKDLNATDRVAKWLVGHEEWDGYPDAYATRFGNADCSSCSTYGLIDSLRNRNEEKLTLVEVKNVVQEGFDFLFTKSGSKNIHLFVCRILLPIFRGYDRAAFSRGI